MEKGYNLKGHQYEGVSNLRGQNSGYNLALLTPLNRIQTRGSQSS